MPARDAASIIHYWAHVIHFHDVGRPLLAASGKLVCRGLSFRQAEFSTSAATLTPQQVQVYNAAAGFMTDLRVNLAEAIMRTRSPSGKVGRCSLTR